MPLILFESEGLIIQNHFDIIPYGIENGDIEMFL